MCRLIRLFGLMQLRSEYGWPRGGTLLSRRAKAAGSTRSKAEFLLKSLRCYLTVPSACSRGLRASRWGSNRRRRQAAASVTPPSGHVCVCLALGESLSPRVSGASCPPVASSIRCACCRGGLALRLVRAFVYRRVCSFWGGARVSVFVSGSYMFVLFCF